MSYIVVFIFTLLVLTAILYIIIYLKLKSQKIPGEQSANAGQQRQQRERNLLKMAIAIVLGFAVSYGWLPRAILFILLFTNSIILPNCGVSYFFYALRLLSVANSTINPSICFIFIGKYRKELQVFLR